MGQVASICTLEASAAGRPAKKGSFASVGATFVRSLASLMETLGACEAHFVRCVKPNPELVPRKLHGESVANQLRMSGMLDAVALIQAGCLPTYMMITGRLLATRDALAALATLAALLAFIAPSGGLPDAHSVRSHPRELCRGHARGGALVSMAMISTEVY